jgi:phosphate transport system substrate-binding protein
VSSTRNWILLSLSVVGLALAACGGAATTPAQATAAPAQPTQPPAQEPAAPTEAPEEGVQLPAVNPLEVSGDVVTAGSSTVFPLAERMAARFEDEGFAGTITIDSIGSGAGLERFCVTGETDVANASRAIRDTEVESCRAIGREPVEFRVGTDALAITVSQENDFITNATVAELALIFGTATHWSDVNPAWPNEPILRFIPGTDSGTFDYFVEEVFEADEAIILAAGNTQLSEDDNVLVQGVLGSPYAVGFFGYAYYAENTDVLKILDIEGVTPSAESVDDGSYPLARPLFLYSDAAILQSKPQVAAYIDFFLSYVNEEILDVGYFPTSAAGLEQSKQAWLDAMSMGG